jgi:hypothetical protein
LLEGESFSNYELNIISHDSSSSAGTSTEPDSLSDTTEKATNFSTTDPLESTYSQYDSESDAGSDATVNRVDNDPLPGHFSTLQVASSDSDPDSSYHGSLRPFYDFRDEMAGNLYKPKTVRDILTKSEIFYEHEIRAWRRYIVVPPGVDHLLYILLKFLQQRVEKHSFGFQTI